MTTVPALRLRLAPNERKRQILDTASRAFGERPYAEVSASALAREAGVTRGLINHYFGDKRELYLTVVRHQVMMPRDGLPQVADRPMAERVDATVDWVLDAATTYGRSWVTVSGSVEIGGDAELQAIVDESDDRAARIVLEILGLAPTDRRRAQLRAYAGMVKAACREWLLQGNLTRAEVHAMLKTTLTTLVSDHDKDSS